MYTVYIAQELDLSWLAVSNVGNVLLSDALVSGVHFKRS